MTAGAGQESGVSHETSRGMMIGQRGLIVPWVTVLRSTEGRSNQLQV